MWRVQTTNTYIKSQFLRTDILAVGVALQWLVLKRLLMMLLLLCLFAMNVE